ncbi:Bax inhibitor-1/YccA family protein [Roseateles amylovorans]|uniref:Bax inhibitor-1/YccA family protein n=1 Tax=Roseateles amylovorans TaxID=2978473 RepID=A0ABY6AUJ1_9BURK|nr:Bax inhibitor-1/YccA family protein [Roseateles amylovorans]UXH76450.1 Bax inhibitor-1/YccA family protein [Roseateles amylovorans]
MNDHSLQPQGNPGGFGGLNSSFAADRQRVLRNTYALLALSLIPTVLGAWIGVQTGLMAAMGTGLSMVVFFVGAFGLMFVVEKTKNSSTGVIALLGFTFFMGLMLSRLLAAVLGFKNGGTLIMTAFGGTAAIFFAMSTLATVVKRDLSGLSKFLFVGAVIAMIAGIANVFLQSTGVQLALLVAVLGIFSAFLLVDVKRIIDGGETNYISATLNIYLDLYNVFTALLQLLGIFGGDRD